MGKRDMIKKIMLSIRDNFILQLLTCSVLSLIVIVGFIIANKIISERNFQKYVIIEDKNFMSTIEYINDENNKFTIEGYAFIIDKHLSENYISVFLRNINNEKELWLEVEQVDRPDVNKYYESKYNYTESGFIATTNSLNINKDQVYEIIINIDYKEANNKSSSKKHRKTVSSKRYILNNKLYTYNPNLLDLEYLDVESDLLREVFSNGKLYVYQKDAGMYVYLYENKLYWIASTDFEFNKEVLTYIPVHIFTTQYNNLPDERIEHKYDNLSFYFERKEINDNKMAPFRVAVCDVPQDYAITYIKTGVYDRGTKIWLWEKLFNLDNIIR